MKDFRKRLWTEHLGTDWMEQFGNLEPKSLQCVRHFQQTAAQNMQDFTHGHRRKSDSVLRGNLLMWSIETDGEKFSAALSEFIPDAPNDDGLWRWRSEYTKEVRAVIFSGIPE